MKGLQPSGIARKNKMIHAGIMLFLEKGYENTSTSEIAKAAGMSQASFFAAFQNKETLLCMLVQEMFENQFKYTEEMMHDCTDPLLLYAVETSMQMYITEMSELLRELYVAAYTLPTTSEFIYRAMAKKLVFIFKEYMPDAQEKDFYELDIASGGITRGFMAKKCDIYFTIEQKIHRYLTCCMKIYNVPQEKIDEVVEQALSMNLGEAAKQAVESAIEKSRRSFEEVMAK